MAPYPTGYFLPLHSTTVATAAEMLWRIAGKPEPDMAQEGFNDVAGGSDHEKAALWAKQSGVYTGVDGSFHGNTSLTWQTVTDMTINMLHENVIGKPSDPEAVMSRADLSGIEPSVKPGMYVIR